MIPVECPKCNHKGFVGERCFHLVKDNLECTKCGHNFSYDAVGKTNMEDK